MNVQPTQPSPQPQAPSGSAALGISPSERQRPGVSGPVKIGLIAVLALCLCAAVCGITFAGTAGLAVLGARQQESEKAPVQSVLDAFMKSMAAKDLDAAHELFSPRAQPQVPVSDLRPFTEGSFYALFKGYQSLAIYDLNIKYTTDPDPKMPQGLVAVVTATTYYDCGCQGTLEATLEKVDGEWRLDGFNVTVPPEMLGR